MGQIRKSFFLINKLA
jgi:U5 small nuclear ribonucleoprotein component